MPPRPFEEKHPAAFRQANSSNGDKKSRTNDDNNNKSTSTAITPVLKRLTKRSSSAPPPSTGRGKRMIEQHYLVETEVSSKKHLVVLPGLPPHKDEDVPKDYHDFFNLIILVPLIVLNIMNWNWDMILNGKSRHHHKDKDKYNNIFAEAWVGDWFHAFFFATLAYFVIDICWILIQPKCVRSPITILLHHFATLFYICIPFSRPELQWAMGACMCVEVNTWLLLGRRVFNKQGFPPWTIGLPFSVSIRVKLISTLFYVTWISIRCILYPYLMVIFFQMWMERREKYGNCNVLSIACPLHAVFCILNLKWTYDLIMSKMRYWKRKKRHAYASAEGKIVIVDKGL